MNSKFLNLKKEMGLAVKEDNHEKIISVLEKVLELAAVDFLTSTLVRWRIEHLLSEALSKAHSSGEFFSILMIDVDKFKKVNDRHGHTAGDSVLQKISDIIRKKIRSTDYVGRWGGEEFLIILPSTNSDDSKIIGERLCKAIELEKLGVTISVGAAQYKGGDKINSIVNRADKLLYRAKKSGGNKCH